MIKLSSTKDNNDKSQLFRIEVFYGEEAGGQARAGRHKCRLLRISRSGVVYSQIFIRDSFKKRNETRLMINPILHIRVTETK